MSNRQHEPASTTNSLADQVRRGWSTFTALFGNDRLGQIGLLLLLGFIFIGAFAPFLAPYDPGEMNRDDQGDILRLDGPSTDHLFGTTQLGRDVFSQVIVGTRVSLLVGVSAATMSVFIGTNVGLISGYKGGYVDDVLMRITDIAYALPFLPFVIVLVVILGADIMNIIIAIALIQWRSTARVVRSQVLSHKERPYVESAYAAGAGDLRVMYRHILPNVLPLVFLYAALAIAWAIIAEASIAFLGFGDPELHSWGQMIYDAYNVDAIRFAYWWVIPPGMSIVLLAMSVFFVGRTLEQITNPELRHRE
ncbi:ABC transporter permease [Natrarchaeobius oligotrophus]|uniref:ABC transporter permease n=1 Tax=Natrarchaeobius chitinivorans TaxID=1679083 RepID=A0A3N6PKV9_NATCH|nr:ABC transporter permease [Natrarchaeobius chitinivorans]RQG99465.1 ABC transporter permease [Natrarchaeobius chitinivorans]